MKTCRECEHYKDETFTPTGIGIGYCYVKESRRNGLPTGSLKTVVYEDGRCKCWKGKMKNKGPIVIIINGAGGVGKDSICDVISNNYIAFVYSSITPIKRIAHHIGWDGEKTDKARKMLSDLKDICTEYNDLPFKYMAEKLMDTRFYRGVEFVIFHIREPQEIAKFRQYAKEQTYTCKTLLIRSKRAQQSYGNHADDDVENYPYDMVYQNEGTLENLDRDFMAFWRKEMHGEG